MKLKDWINHWQKALTEAKIADLSETKDIQPTRDFLFAVQELDLMFASQWLNKLELKGLRETDNDWQKDYDPVFLS